jgi:hypothetical protein
VKTKSSGCLFPVLLFINAHAKIRLSIELAFSGCMAESRSLMRDAIEFVAHAHSMLADPLLQKVWLSKNEGKTHLDAFKNAFEANKKKGLFKGLEQLHGFWSDLSETGSHANLNALIDRFQIHETETHFEYKINYTGVAPDMWEKSVFLLLQACTLMEAEFFSDYYSRLNLDIDLIGMRQEALDLWKEISRSLIKKYNLKPPPSP